MRVLAGGGRDGDIRPLPGEFLDEGAPFRLAGEDFERPRAAWGNESGKA
jgi:hypothetical protein